MIKDQAVAFGRRSWQGFLGFTPGQKLVAGAALVALVVGGYFLFAWKPATPYAPLYTNLAATDASSIVDKLNSAGIPYKLTDGGASVEVPQDKVYSTRLTMSSAGLPGSGDTGYSLLDKEGVTTSQFKQQVDYQRAIEGELAKTIESMSGVNAASVHLAIPQQDVFNDGSQPTTAAVMLATNPATTLTTDQVQSVVYLVSSSVPGLKTSDVTVSDSNGNVLKAPGDGYGSAASASTQTQATQAYDSQLASKLQSLLDKALGPNHAMVTVNSTLNFNQTSTTKRTYSYPTNTPPLSEQKTVEKYTGAGANAAGGTAGTGGTTTDNTNTAGSGGAGSTGGTGNGTYSNVGTTVNNSVDTQVQTTQSAPGTVQNQAVAVVLDKSVKGLNVAAITKLLQSGAGINSARGDTLSVQAMSFDTTAAQAATAAGAAATKSAQDAASQAQLMSWIKQGVLVLLVLGLILAAVIAAMKRRDSADRSVPNDDVFGLDDQLQDAFTPDERRAAVNDLQAAAARRRSLVNAVEDRPDQVARALSGWLNTKEKTP